MQAITVFPAHILRRHALNHGHLASIGLDDVDGLGLENDPPVVVHPEGDPIPPLELKGIANRPPPAVLIQFWSDTIQGGKESSA
jgi:hypothetical protein